MRSASASSPPLSCNNYVNYMSPGATGKQTAGGRCWGIELRDSVRSVVRGSVLT